MSYLAKKAPSLRRATLAALLAAMKRAGVMSLAASIHREDRRLERVGPGPVAAALGVAVEAGIEAEEEQVRGGRQRLDARPYRRSPRSTA